MNSLVISILTMGILGALFAYGLSIARKRFKVEEDRRIDQIAALLPGANCGGCGYPGCRAFAEAVVSGKAKPDGCPVGGTETAKEIAGIMGVEITETERQAVVLLCRGTEAAAKRKAEYRGIKTCYAAKIIQKGDKYCEYGCLGFGDCVDVCKYDALKMGEAGIPVVDREKCVACRLCVNVCPNHLLEIHPLSRTFFVFCKSHEGAKASITSCKNACTGCKLCTKGVKNEEIVVDNNLSVIKDIRVTDDESVMEWVKKCPTKAIGFL